MRAHAIGEDRGAQPQRTVLAWNRTIVSTVLGCALVALTAQRQHITVVAVLAAFAAVFMLGTLRHLRRWNHEGDGRYHLVRSAVASVAVLAALGTTIAVTGALT